jgi:hypothetical protein
MGGLCRFSKDQSIHGLSVIRSAWFCHQEISNGKSGQLAICGSVLLRRLGIQFLCLFLMRARSDPDRRDHSRVVRKGSTCLI